MEEEYKNVKAGWYVVETDDQSRQFLAHWVCYPTQIACERAIPHLGVTSWVGPLSARLHDGKEWQ